MSVRSRKKEEPSPPVGSLAGNAITFKPGRFADPRHALGHKPANTNMHLGKNGYFTVHIEKNTVAALTGGSMQPKFEGQKAVRVTVGQILNTKDRLDFSKRAGDHLGRLLGGENFEDGVAYNGYYCASPELSTYSVTYAEKAANMVELESLPAAVDMMSRIFTGEAVAKDTRFELDGFTYVWTGDSKFVTSPMEFKAHVTKVDPANAEMQM
jgi:hypothetical protein